MVPYIAILYTRLVAIMDAFIRGAWAELKGYSFKEGYTYFLLTF